MHSAILVVKLPDTEATAVNEGLLLQRNNFLREAALILPRYSGIRALSEGAWQSPAESVAPLLVDLAEQLLKCRFPFEVLYLDDAPRWHAYRPSPAGLPIYERVPDAPAP